MTKVGRNDPCPCGSGKKYKHCCLGKEPRALDELNHPVGSEPALFAPASPPVGSDPTGQPWDIANGIELADSDFWNSPETTSKDRAFALLEEAWESSDSAERIDLAKRALAEWPDCVGAYALLGDESERPDDAIKHYQEALSAADRVLGADWWEAHQRYDWDDPFEVEAALEVRTSLARALMELGRADEAIEHFRFLLRHDPEDYDGSRYDLLDALLYADRDEEALALIHQFSATQSARWPYARALLKFRRDGDGLWSRRALVDALRFNALVTSHLLGTATIPDSPSVDEVFSGEIDAADAARYLVDDWRRTPGALDWLREIYEAGPDARLDAAPRGDGPVLCMTPTEALGYIRCPRCERKTKPRRRDVVVLLEPDEMIAVRVACRQCESCDTLAILARDLHRAVESALKRRSLHLTGRDFASLGIIDPGEAPPRPEDAADGRWLTDHLRRWSDEVVPLDKILAEVDGGDAFDEFGELEPEDVIDVPFATRTR